MTNRQAQELNPAEREELLATLEERFHQNMDRHGGLDWSDLRARLEAHPEKLRSLWALERTGGEPDVIDRDDETGAFLFVDCSSESPEGRRSLCYDREALESRKKHRPESSAIDQATAMGAVLMTEDEYRRLQEVGEFDTRTSSWLLTPDEVRALGGAIFGDHRFGTTWIYHNGAQSYYASRGFRCSLRV